MSDRTKALPGIFILFGIGLRLWNVYDDPTLWLDEIFSAKMAEAPLKDLLLAVPRFDTHPPAYYLQLHFWALISQEDSWLLLNSALLDILTILSLWFVTSRIYNANVGAWTAAVYAVLPLSVFFAENLRMYAMFFLLIVWLWYLVELRVHRGHASMRERLGTVTLGVAATLTHGLGFFVVFFTYFQGIIRLHGHHRDRQGLRAARLLGLEYIPIALVAGYSVLLGMFRQTEGMMALDFQELGAHLSIAFWGMEFPFPVYAGYIAFILVLFPPLLYRQARQPLMWLVLLPILLLLVLSITKKSIFMYRTMGLFWPFLAVSLGLLYQSLWKGKATGTRVVPFIYLTLFSLAAVNSSIGFRKAGYEDVAALWEDQATTEAILFVEGPVNLWGVTRYLGEAPAFSALTVQPPVREGLLKLKEKLRGSFLERAGFFGTKDHLAWDQKEIWPYLNEERLQQSDSYWALDPPGGGCPRPGDRTVEKFAPRGHILIKCQYP